jgi:hypothetical protein
MAKKRGKVFRRQADRSWNELKSRKPKQFEGELKSIMRQAAKAGAAEAIEHCANFWNVSDGYKKYIDHQIELQTQTLMAAVRSALRGEIARAERRRKR